MGWLVLVISAVFILAAISSMRLKIPRDLSREKPDDLDSTLAYNRVSRWMLFSLIRFYMLRQINKLQPHGVLLDAGCGPGYLALEIARRYPEVNVRGIDISMEMLNIAAVNRSSSALQSRVNFQEADVLKLPFKSNSLDFTVSTLSMHHWPDADLSLLEIYRVLKPGGQLLIFDLRRDMPVILFLLVKLGQRILAPRPIQRVNGGVGSVWSSFTCTEMRKLISQSSFQNWKVTRGWGWAYIWGRK
jgi:ubiquinone/menaquinone biosynthesis C-methylase UbiE